MHAERGGQKMIKAGEEPAFSSLLGDYLASVEAAVSLFADFLFAVLLLFFFLVLFAGLGVSVADDVLAEVDVSPAGAAAAVNVTAANSAATTAEISCFMVSSF